MGISLRSSGLHRKPRNVAPEMELDVTFSAGEKEDAFKLTINEKDL